jgi:Lrp/AsnC family transcriptional regulator for asnA, asnC and gidA
MHFNVNQGQRQCGSNFVIIRFKTADIRAKIIDIFRKTTCYWSRDNSLDIFMDELDKLILRTLQTDGRTPFTQIARQAGVSETTIRSRYRNLVVQGVVHTVSIVDPFALDFLAPAILNIVVEPGQVDQVAGAMAQLPEVSYLIRTLGAFDLVVEVYCRDLAHLTDLVTERIHTIRGVRGVETAMIAKSYKLSYRWSPALDLEDGDEFGQAGPPVVER